MTYWKISALFNAGMLLTLGVFIFAKCRRLPAGRALVVFNITAFAWSVSYFLWQCSADISTAIFWLRVLTVFSAFVGPSFVHYIVHLIGRWKEMRRWIAVSYCVGIVESILVGTPLIIGSVGPFLSFPFWPKAGPLYILQILNYFIPPSIVVYLMLKDYRNSSRRRKQQTRLVIIAALIGFLSGASNYPQWYGIKIYPIFNGLVWLNPLIMFYAIIRYRLMEIDTVIHRTLLWMLTSSLIFIPICVLLYFTRSWLVTLNWIQLSLVTTTLFYVYLHYYHKMQPRIDHLFRRRKYDYYQILSEIGEKIGTELDINNVITRLFKELKEVLYIRNGLILVQQLGQQNYTEAGSIGYDKLQDTSKDRQGGVLYASNLSQWLNAHQKALEREQIEIDPQYESIKQETLTRLNQNMIELLIPIIMEDKVNGLIGIGKKENLQAYTARDIELLEKMGHQIGVTIDNALHHEDIVEKGRLDEELKLGREIQMNLLPRQIPCVPHLSLQGMMTPAKEIGGDYYDFIGLPNKEELAIVIGDVSGKGVAAGLLMSMVKATIHAFSQEGASPKQILLRTNVFLHQNIGGQKFMTLLYLKWQSQSRTIHYSSAGHEHILLYRTQTQEVQAIQSGGFMLGMVPDIGKFLEEKQIQLNPQDKILLYTDGVTEAENASGDRFGLERLKESFQRHSQKPPNELMQAVKDETYAFIGSHLQYDDITLVVMEAQ